LFLVSHHQQVSMILWKSAGGMVEGFRTK